MTELSLSAEALAALKEFARERGITDERDDEDDDGEHAGIAADDESDWDVLECVQRYFQVKDRDDIFNVDYEVRITVTV